MSQYDFGTIVASTKTGTQLASDLNSWRDALATNHKGSVRPTYVQAGMVWIDDSASPWVLYTYDGNSDIPLFSLDPTGHAAIPYRAGSPLPSLGTAAERNIGTALGDVPLLSANGGLTLTGPLNQAAFVDVASASSVDIGAAASDSLRITGTTAITSFGTAAAGVRRVVRFTAALVLTHSGTSLILPTAADITTASDDTAEFASLGSGKWLCLWYKRASGAPVGHDAPRGHLVGLTLSNNSASPNTKIDIAAGEAADTGYAVMMRSSGNLIVDCGTTGANGLDVGSLAADTWYHAFLIMKADKTVAGLVSTSVTTPALPSGFTYKRRLGSFKTDGSAQIIAFSQYGDEFLKKTTTTVENTSDHSAGVLINVDVPTGVNVWAIIIPIVNDNGGQQYGTYISAPDQDNPPASADNVQAMGVNANFYAGGNGQFNVRTDTSGQIRIRAEHAVIDTKITTVGWIDRRGRDD